jgi:putative NADH-flavin reductase
MDVFLTGATGYIGGAIADALLRAGHGVLGLARSDKVTEVMRARSISPLRGVLRDSASLTRGAQQADAVIQAGTTNSSDMDRVDIAAVDAILVGLKEPGSHSSIPVGAGCLATLGILSLTKGLRPTHRRSLPGVPPLSGGFSLPQHAAYAR